MKAKEREGCVYLLRNLVNGKCYVGQRNNVGTVERRWAGHIADAKRGSKNPIHAAIRKYGIDGISAEVIWRGPIDDLDAAEVRCIIEHRAKKPNGYNVVDGGVGVRGLRHSSATRERIRVSVCRTLSECLQPGERSRIMLEVWKRPEYQAAVYKGVDAARGKTSKAAKIRWARMSAEERAGAVEAAHASVRWWERPIEQQAEVRAKLSRSWSSKTDEERAAIYAKRGRAIHEAAVRRRNGR